MKHTKKRVAALLLALAMVLSLMPMAFAADAGFPDMPAEDDPSYAAVLSAVENGILKGDGGKLNLEGSILRSSMAAIITRVFGAKGEADLSAYTDAEGHWSVASGELPAAVAMGIMSGTSADKMEPNRAVKLEEVITMLVRALGLPLGTAEDLEGIPGADSVDNWAVPYVAALVKANYISDVTGANEPMTRGAFTEMIYTISGEGNYVKEAAEITEDVEGNIIISSDGVSLKGITVNGDVIIADGVDVGSIDLDGVTINGRLLVRGGAEVNLSNGTTATSTVVAKTEGEVTLTADKDSDAGAIAVAGTNNGAEVKVAEKVIIDMPEPEITVSAGTEVALRNANGGSVVLGDNASLTVESGTVENVVVVGEDVAVEVAKDATIEKVTTNTDITITGEGTVEEKEGSGTVTDPAGNEVSGSDEKVELPELIPTVATEPDSPDDLTAHVHNYATEDISGQATGGDTTKDVQQFDATRHTVACVDKAVVTNADGEEVAAAIVGCGAVIYQAHRFDPETNLCICGYEKQVTTVTATEPTGADADATCGEGNHEWEEMTSAEASAAGITLSDLDCVTDGVVAYKCKNNEVPLADGTTGACKATRVVRTPALGHTKVLLIAKEPTCTVSGYRDYQCSRCEKFFKDTAGTVSLVDSLGAGEHSVNIATTDHKLVLTGNTTPANCTVPGTREWACSVCKVYTHDEDLGVDSKAHVWSDWVDDEDETNHTRTCTVEHCDGNDPEGNEAGEQPATQTRTHTWINDPENPAVPATCKDKGHTAGFKCSVCTATKDGAEIEKIDHTFGDWVNTDATHHWKVCTTAGCGVKDPTTNSDANKHDWDADTGKCKVCARECEHAAIDGTTKKCTVCGAAPTHVHVWEDGTCTSTKYLPTGAAPCVCPDVAGHAEIYTTAKCGTCGGAGTKALTACSKVAGHTDLYPTQTCDECGYVGVKVCTNVANHSKCVVTACPTCGYFACRHTWEDGICTKCDAECEHDYPDPYTDGKCTICGLQCTTHTYPETDSDGECSVCHFEHTGHTYPETNSDGKCVTCHLAHTCGTTAAGYDADHTCKTCHKVHVCTAETQTTTTGTPATCVATGTEDTVTCICGKVTGGGEIAIDAENHAGTKGADGNCDACNQPYDP